MLAVFVYRRFNRLFQSVSFCLWANQSLALMLSFAENFSEFLCRNLFILYAKRNDGEFRIAWEPILTTPRPRNAKFAVYTTFSFENKTDDTAIASLSM
jgi:hypothetical protein